MSAKISKHMTAMSSTAGSSAARIAAISTIESVASAIHPVASACSSVMPSGSTAPRSNGPMLSMPRKPPAKTPSPSGSFLPIHHVMLTSSRLKTCRSQTVSRLPSILKTRNAAHACTGGFTAPKSHS